MLTKGVNVVVSSTSAKKYEDMCVLYVHVTGLLVTHVTTK